MKILYDHQIFTNQNFGGISRYFYEVINGLNTQTNLKCEISLLVSNNHYISDRKIVNHINVLPNKNFRGKVRLLNLINKPYSILKIRKQQYDIFHPTYYDPYFLKYIGSKPFVVTVYDMIHEKFKDMFPQKDKTSHYKELLVKKAAKIIAISENTKKDIIDIFGIDESKIDVVYLGNSMLVKTNISLNFKLPDKYILFVGNRSGYKNFERFIKSISKILSEDRDLYAICAGGGIFKNNEIYLLSELKIKNKVLQYNVNDEELAYLYRNALAFVFPSLYEGFGIPILEAFACGCPVVCSNSSSFPEIAEEAAYYFDPYSENSINYAIIKVSEDRKLRNELINKGYEKLKEFSWEKTAEQTKKVYEDLLK